MTLYSKLIEKCIFVWYNVRFSSVLPFLSLSFLLATGWRDLKWAKSVSTLSAELLFFIIISIAIPSSTWSSFKVALYSHTSAYNYKEESELLFECWCVSVRILLASFDLAGSTVGFASHSLFLAVSQIFLFSSSCPPLILGHNSFPYFVVMIIVLHNTCFVFLLLFFYSFFLEFPAYSLPLFAFLKRWRCIYHIRIYFVLFPSVSHLSQFLHLSFARNTKLWHSRLTWASCLFTFRAKSFPVFNYCKWSTKILIEKINGRCLRTKTKNNNANMMWRAIAMTSSQNASRWHALHCNDHNEMLQRF